MNENDLRYHLDGHERLYGRAELLDSIMHELAGGCTIFGIDGVSGIGKSEVVVRFATVASQQNNYDCIFIDIADHAAQEQLIAALYTCLKALPRSVADQGTELVAAIVAKAPDVVRRVLIGAMQDVMNKLNDNLENTVSAIAAEISGDREETGAGALLSSISESNQRYFMKEFMAFMASAGKPVILVFDNYEDAEPSAQEFLNWLISVKPVEWVVIIVANVEKVTNTDWQRRMAPGIQMRSGTCHSVDAPDRRALSDWFEDEVKRRPADHEIDHAIGYTNGGRPVWLKSYLAAVAKGEELPKVPDLRALLRVRRTNFGPAARSVAELMALSLPDARIPREWVERAAALHGVTHVGSALDTLIASSEIVETDGKLRFYNSSYRNSWRDGLAESDLKRVQSTWYSVYTEISDAMIALPAAGVLPGLASEIAAHEDVESISRIATDLLHSGSVNTALTLVDASWQAGGKANTTGAQVIEHALIAAQARLDVGRYREAHESLRMIARQSDKNAQQAIRADLLGLKLALRQNAYSAVWSLSSKLQNEAGDDPEIQLSRELVVNAAYRDLLRKPEISDSVELIRSYFPDTSRESRAKAQRSLARSLAKLGRTDEAIDAAVSSVSLAEDHGDVREIANAQLAMAESLRYAGELEKAAAAYRSAETLARGVGNRDCEIWSILGRICAHLEAGDFGAAEKSLRSCSGILDAPGFEHPLETAHLSLLSYALKFLLGDTADLSEPLQHYQAIGVDWPEAFLNELGSTRSIAGHIPI